MSLGWGDNTWGANGWGGTLAVTGNLAAGSVGTVIFVPVIYVAITGIASSGNVGNLSPSSSSLVQMSGVSGTGAAGTMIGIKSFALTGVSANGKIENIGYRYWSIINDGQTPNWAMITTV